MRHSATIRLALAAGLAAVLGAATASAAVVGVSPNADLSQGPFTISFGDGDATYTFGDSGETGPFGGAVPFATTGGSAEILSMVPSFGGRIARISVGGNAVRSVGEAGSNEVYRSFDMETINLPNEVYIGLSFTLDDGQHFGFARIGGLTLFDIAYEDVPGMAVTPRPGPYEALPQPAPVPLPATLPLMGAAMLGFGAIARRRRKAA